MAVYGSLNLYVTQDRFYIEPINVGVKELLIIDRVSEEIALRDHYNVPSDSVSKPIHGIMGIVKLLAGSYLLVITEKEKVGEINKHLVWRVVKTELFRYKRTLMHLNEVQTQDEKVYVSMINYHLLTDGFYFTTSFDLTHTLQRLQNASPEFLNMPLHERADHRFLWNSHIMRDLAQQPELSRYCLPVIHGLVGISWCYINSLPFQLILISRRSILRAGTRFYMRGLDNMGHTANFVETEQILAYEGHLCSLVQTRGSIPLYWTQEPNLRYMPQPSLGGSENHVEGFQLHFDGQVYNYGRQVLVNLVNHYGYEKKMEKAFSDAVQSSQSENIRYVSFDFHTECRHQRWDRLINLIQKLESDIRNFGYMHIYNGEVRKYQEGVFRTNCMDCLDRTNVVQGLIAKDVLQTQLQEVGILRSDQDVSEQTIFMNTFREVWTNNANYLSKQYAGTGALKTDFTRTGKRTQIGLINDFINSITRYFKNNFYDGFRQDSIDLFLGNYVIDENEANSPLRTQKDWKFYALPVIFLVALGMLIISILLPDEHSGEQALYVIFWAGASLVSLSLVFFYGTEFVDRPRLAQAKLKLE